MCRRTGPSMDFTAAEVDLDPGPSSSYNRSFPANAQGPIRPLSPPSSPLFTAAPSASETITAHNAQSLYTILNLDRDASDAEIRDRYRALATTFHPDRQRDTEGRTAAHTQFTEIQRAYEVLTDPTKRTVYDLFGEEGLKTSWEIGPRVRTTEEMRSHFQRQAYDKRRLEAEALVKAKGDINIVLDARAALLHPSAFDHPERMSHTPIARLKRIRPTQMMIKHSFETPLSDNTQLVWTGQMASSVGRGAGNVVGTLRHQFSPKFWVEGGSSFLPPRSPTAKGTYSFNEHT